MFVYVFGFGGVVQKQVGKPVLFGRQAWVDQLGLTDLMHLANLVGGW